MKGIRKQQAVVEAIDSVAAMVVHRAEEEDKQVFMVSSALPGEGKSTVSCQLAHSIALAGKKVALVDFDLRRPSIHEMLQLPLEPGITDVLQGRFNWTDITHTSSNLHILTAGSPLNGLQRFWNSGAIDRLFVELRNNYDLVIVDGCPILPVADSRIIGKMADGVILSLIRDRSSLPKAVEACELLKSYGVTVSGTVVLGASSSGYSSKYYYRSKDSEPNTGTLVSGKPK